MKFVDGLFSLIADFGRFIGELFNRLFDFLAQLVAYLVYFFDGIFYFIVKLFSVVVSVIKIFVALFQFFGSLVVGFIRTIGSMLTIDFSKTPVNYPDSSLIGINTVLDLIDPMGMLDVVPLILIALVWFIFIKRIIALIGGEIRA